jgi:glutamine amidotransferase
VIALIDYGAGNLTSVRKALGALGADYAIPQSPADLAGASGVIVPGVGHFTATAALEGAWHEAIAASVRRGVPLFGICLGMQWLFEASDEDPNVRGLGVIPGRIARLKGNVERRVKVPHVGWNALEFRDAAPAGESGPRLLRGLQPGDRVYFTHSYAAPVTPEGVALTTHGDETFASVVERGTIFGVQFHPEKSSDPGLQIIRNFLDACRC